MKKTKDKYRDNEITHVSLPIAISTRSIPARFNALLVLVTLLLGQCPVGIAPLHNNSHFRSPCFYAITPGRVKRATGTFLNIAPVRFPQLNQKTRKGPPDFRLVNPSSFFGGAGGNRTHVQEPITTAFSERIQLFSSRLLCRQLAHYRLDQLPNTPWSRSNYQICPLQGCLVEGGNGERQQRET